MDKYLVFPMATYVFYMFILMFYNFRTRVHAAKSGQLPPKYFKALQGDAPDRLIIVGRHYDNQFQLPVLFFITCLVYMVMAKTNELAIVWAWLFVVTRWVHSFIHLGSNRVMRRAQAFGAGWLIIFLMWVQLVYLVF